MSSKVGWRARVGGSRARIVGISASGFLLASRRCGRDNHCWRIRMPSRVPGPHTGLYTEANRRSMAARRVSRGVVQLSLMARSQKCKGERLAAPPLKSQPPAKSGGSWGCFCGRQRITWLVIDDVSSACVYHDCCGPEMDQKQVVWVGHAPWSMQIINLQHVRNHRCDIYMYRCEVQIRDLRSKPLRRASASRPFPWIQASLLPKIDANIATLGNN